MRDREPTRYIRINVSAGVLMLIFALVVIVLAGFGYPIAAIIAGVVGFFIVLYVASSHP